MTTEYYTVTIPIHWKMTTYTGRSKQGSNRFILNEYRLLNYRSQKADRRLEIICWGLMFLLTGSMEDVIMMLVKNILCGDAEFDLGEGGSFADVVGVGKGELATEAGHEASYGVIQGLVEARQGDAQLANAVQLLQIPLYYFTVGKGPFR